MATTGIEETLILPGDALPSNHVFGMDIGGSLIKVAHHTKEGNDTHIRFSSYAKENLEDALKDIKDKVIFQENMLITTTGVGSYQYKSRIEEVLGVKVNNVLEMDCFVRALKLLIASKPLKEFVYRPSEKAAKSIKETESLLSGLRERLAASGSKTEPWEVPEDTASDPLLDDTKLTCDDVFPCLLTMLGSGAGYMVVDAEGTVKGTDQTTTAGRMILGLGSLLCGTSSFDELVALAEGGDASKVEVQCKDLRRKDGVIDSSDLYQHLPANMPVYSFGHCVGKNISDFRKEDFAAAIISNVCQTLAMGCHLSNAVSDVKIVLFCGSVCGHSEYIRDELSTHFGIRNRNNNFKSKNRPFYFLKYGGYLGAFGTLVPQSPNAEIDDKSNDIVPHIESVDKEQ